jgi:hypothetical protein
LCNIGLHAFDARVILDLDRLLLKNVMGGDWLIIAGIAFMEKIKTIESVSVHSWPGGSAVSYKAMASRLGLTRFEKCFPHLAIAFHTFEDISKKNSLLTELTKTFELSICVGSPCSNYLLAGNYSLTCQVSFGKASEIRSSCCFKKTLEY